MTTANPGNLRPYDPHAFDVRFSQFQVIEGKQTVVIYALDTHGRLWRSRHSQSHAWDRWEELERPTTTQAG